ncbi:MAG TPA: NAD-dependent epimerase/dehydratase family protein, partial [Gemmatimonadetes bacterium]|nr:NAD-dependent epimerase/dehydratase family protein [Gemmatimonadota bacterium]
MSPTAKCQLLGRAGLNHFGVTIAIICVRIIVFSRDELKQHEMQQDFPVQHSPMRYFLGDIRDRDRLAMAFHNVDIVVHAAALKQVPACEYNPFEAVLTNIMGAKNIIGAAISEGVERVLAVSTDKA